MYTEDDLLPISALPQLVYCERRCALIHIECVWDDNRFTVEGAQLHEHVHERGDESRGDVRIARGLALRSLRLGLVGKADVVEFQTIPGQALQRLFPVEYKRGKPKPDASDEVQLCAQAVCLEEMLGVDVPAGALFYGATRRRHDVTFSPELRAATEQAADRLHRLFDSRITPKPEPGPKCKKCSLVDLCMPNAASGRSAARYLQKMMEENLTGRTAP